MDCSIVICTRNRAESLRRTLAAIVRQVYRHGELEILVVDNASDDHTRQVTEGFRAHDPRIRYVVEPTPGLSVARNTGVAHARGEIVAFLDDDAWPVGTDWAERLVDVYDDPQIAAAGGDIELAWPSGRQPTWLHDALLPCLGRTRFHSAETTTLANAHGVWGTNMSFRRARILPPHGFQTHLGHVGEVQGAGEEVELCQRLAATGHRIVYAPGAAVMHAVTPDTLTEAWFRACAWDHGRADAAIARAHFSTGRLWRTALKRLTDAAIQTGAIAIFRLTGAHRVRLWCQYRLRYSSAYLLRLLAR